MTTETSPSQMAAELQAVRSELKALKETVARMQTRFEEIEEELTAIRNLI